MANHIDLNDRQIQTINGYFGEKIIQPELRAVPDEPIKIHFGKAGDEELSVLYRDVGGQYRTILTPDYHKSAEHECFVNERGDKIDESCGDVTSAGENYGYKIDSEMVRIFMAAIAPKELSAKYQSVLNDSRVENLRKALGINKT